MAAIFIFQTNASAVEIRDEKIIVQLMRTASTAQTTADLDKALREAAKIPPPKYTDKIGDAFAVIWHDNSIPRARIWMRNIDAERLFRNILMDQYLIEGAELRGKVDVDMEIRSGRPAIIRGRLRFRDTTLKWRLGDFALEGMQGFMPFQRTIGGVDPHKFNALVTNKMKIDRLVWADRPLATQLTASVSYNNKVMRFNKIRLDMLGGSGLGNVVIDHRRANWRMAAMMRFNNAELSRMSEILPGLPILASFTKGKMNGDVAMIFQAPNAINLTGDVTSTEPGVIRVAPRLYNKMKQYMKDPTIEFQKLQMELLPARNGNIEAEINITRKSARNFYDLTRGVPFAPLVFSIRFPLLPLVSELSMR